MQTSKNCVIFLILGLLAGIAGTSIFVHNASFTPEQIAMRTLASGYNADIQARLNEARLLYDGKPDTLQQTDSIPDHIVAVTQTTLQHAKTDKPELVTRVDTLIARPAAARDCDTLQNVLPELTVNAGIQDSTCDTLITTLLLQLTNKDNIITTQQLEYASLQVSMEENASQQQVITVQLRNYQQQALRFKTRNKLLSAGIMLLTGLTTYGLLHH